MNQNRSKTTSGFLIDAIVEGVRRKKGEGIIDLDLDETGNTECSHYIICHGNSNTQVEAIARSVEETVEEITGENVWHSDGYRNAQWILLDYCDVMVHIFQKDYRLHYNLESLWADSKLKSFQSDL